MTISEFCLVSLFVTYAFLKTLICSPKAIIFEMRNIAKREIHVLKVDHFHTKSIGAVRDSEHRAVSFLIIQGIVMHNHTISQKAIFLKSSNALKRLQN